MTKITRLIRAVIFVTFLQLAFPFAFSGRAQAAAEHDMQMWTPITLDARIYGKFRGYFEVNPRMTDGVSGLGQLIIRPGIEYRVNDNFSLMSGYAWQSIYGGEQVRHENRIWQQVLLHKGFKRCSIINRTRLEQRLFNHLDGSSNRIRHMVKLNVPVQKRLYATVSDELFINFNSITNGPQAGIDQNRLFVGMGYRFRPKARVEAGYQLQYINRSEVFDDQANHAIVIQSFFGLRD
jgi:hypothetical protein